jgi:hypothetical protein
MTTEEELIIAIYRRSSSTQKGFIVAGALTSVLGYNAINRTFEGRVRVPKALRSDQKLFNRRKA